MLNVSIQILSERKLESQASSVGEQALGIGIRASPCNSSAHQLQYNKKGVTQMFYIGCPMWGYKDWVGTLFPPHTPASDFLRLYSNKLSTVEGNTTFYALPSQETIARWRQETS